MPVAQRSLLACFLFAFVILLPGRAIAGCVVSPSVTSALGTYSPPAVQVAAVPALQSRAGLVCPTATLTLISNNSIKAKLSSLNGFVLLRTGGGSVPYKASADAGGTVPFAQGQSIDYMQNNLLNLLGLLGGSSADLPFFITPVASATRPPIGSYVDTITIDWDWNLCPGIGALGACVGVRDQATGRSVIVATLTVSAQDVVLTLATKTSWDPTDGSSYPKSVPGSKQRVALLVTNPDIVPLGTGTLAVVLPTPTNMVVALDGDGTSSGVVISLTDGSPASGVTLRYGGASDTTDDVDFSADGGAHWTYTPSGLQDPAITHVRLRPQGAMAAQSAFSVSIPYVMK